MLSALAGLPTVLVMLALIMTKRLSAMLALIVTPVAAALIMGFGLDTSRFIVTGISSVAPVAVMFIFTIRSILKTARGDHQRFTISFAYLVSLSVVFGSVLFGLYPL